MIERLVDKLRQATMTPSSVILCFVSVNIVKIELLSTFSDSIPVSFHSGPSFICFERVLKRETGKVISDRDGETAPLTEVT